MACNLADTFASEDDHDGPSLGEHPDSSDCTSREKQPEDHDIEISDSSTGNVSYILTKSTSSFLKINLYNTC